MLDPSILDLHSPRRYPISRRLPKPLGEQTMQGVKGAIIITTIIAAVTLGACRREVPYEPMKLGADLPVAEKVAR
jgi:hypothetical protein